MDNPIGLSGLTEAEAAHRLESDGPNELAAATPRTPWRIGLEVAREPMFQLLVAAGLLYLMLGDLGEALMLLAFVAMTVTITVVQERRTERALEALRDLTSPRALVVRDGVHRRIAGREVVRGDLLVLAEGDRVAADAQLLSSNDLQADESLLTGEALPVGKVAAAGAVAALRPGGDGQPMVYAATLVVRGHGLARVIATGAATEVGSIGKALATIASPPTPLTVQTRRLVRVLSVFGLGLSALVVVLYGLIRGDWTGGLLAGITLAMSLLPEEFLLILTVFMAMGAWRMSRANVLTRRAATIEALGSATVLCTDKTGTLTQNRMAVAGMAIPVSDAMNFWAAGSRAPPQAFHDLLEFALLASERDPFDPMDKAIHSFGREHLGAARLHDDWTLAHDYGLSPELLAMTHCWRSADTAPAVVAIKGAHETVLPRCALSDSQARAVAQCAGEMASRGLRVLAVAGTTFAATDWPASPLGFEFTFLGLVGLADPLRDGVPAAVRECRSAGIRVVMITGDLPGTALAIAGQAGLEAGGAILTGPEIALMDQAELRRRITTAAVFARVMPEQKLRIVDALKDNGEVVAMTGDGVNDAPSLKAAHIGIAMGGRGTDVAREASSLVLLDDDFGSVVRAVRLGRRIYDNLRKAMAFVFAVHVPIAGLSLLPLVFGLPLVFTPVHIAFLELLIDPVCSIVFEAEVEERDVMTRPPRDPEEPLFSAGMIASSLLQGVVVLAAVGAFFVVLLAAAVPEARARAAAFTALVVCNVALIIANRSFTGNLIAAVRRPNPTMWPMLLATGSLLAAVLLIAPVRSLFHFAPLGLPLFAAAMGLGVAVLFVVAVLQFLRRDAPR